MKVTPLGAIVLAVGGALTICSGFKIFAPLLQEGGPNHPQNKPGISTPDNRTPQPSLTEKKPQATQPPPPQEGGKPCKVTAVEVRCNNITLRRGLSMGEFTLTTPDSTYSVPKTNGEKTIPLPTKECPRGKAEATTDSEKRMTVTFFCETPQALAQATEQNFAPVFRRKEG